MNGYLGPFPCFSLLRLFTDPGGHFAQQGRDNKDQQSSKICEGKLETKISNT